MEREKRTLAIGTCRVAGPCEHLTNNGMKGLEKFPHHLHYPAQILQTLKHYDGKSVIKEKLLYLMSEDSIRKSATRQGYVRSHRHEVKTYKGITGNYDRYIIELSALNEVVHPNGMFLEYFAKRDLASYSHEIENLYAQGLVDLVSPSEVTSRNIDDDYYLSKMREITALLGNKPILWVSHFDASAPPRVRESRKRCIDLVRKGASETGGSFFDPSFVINHLGQNKALKENGDDLAHFSDEAVHVLAEVYSSWIEKGRHPWISSPKKKFDLWQKLAFKASGLALIVSTGYYFA